MNLQTIYRVFAILWLVLVGVLSLIPVPKEAAVVSDKTAHFLFYLATSMVVFLAIRSERFLRSLFITVVAVLFYGILLELLQALVPYRTFSMNDILANTLGILTYSVFYMLYYAVKKRFFPSPGS